MDKTEFGRNCTTVPLDGSELPKKTRGGRKTFMLSGATKDDGQMSVVTCRLTSRGEGWYTRMERSVSPSDSSVMHERNVLVRPGEADVVVNRYFNRLGEKVPGAVPLDNN